MAVQQVLIPRRGRQLALHTRKGWQIPNETRYERPPIAMQAAVQNLRSIFPQIRPRSLSSVYDCTGLVFASRRTTVSTDNIHRILSDDDYKRLSDLPDLEEGDLVLYGRGDGSSISHAGIIWSKRAKPRDATFDIMVLSQWGADGEYIHPIDQVPSAYGRPVEYWTDRR